STSQTKEGDDAAEGVRVGEVLVRLGSQQEKEGNAGVKEKGISENSGHSAHFTEKEVIPSVNVFVRKYNPTAEDVNWAQNGVVATVINGEAIPVVQN
ncbi:hypothetical protein A2U01_0074723, partial [Trifolium medium]|nr:hypothetical protein [Trifolium medium]